MSAHDNTLIENKTNNPDAVNRRIPNAKMYRVFLSVRQMGQEEVERELNKCSEKR